MSNNENLIPSASEIGKEAGLVMFGAAAGLLVAGVIGNKACKPLGFILGAAGLAASGPEISKLVAKAINSPTNSFGSKKTLEGIRNSSGSPILESVDSLDQEDTQQMFIG